MTILVKGPDALDIEDLETTVTDDALIAGSFLVKIYAKDLNMASEFTIIDCVHGNRWLITECRITSRDIKLYGTEFEFIAQGLEKES